VAATSPGPSAAPAPAAAPASGLATPGAEVVASAAADDGNGALVTVVLGNAQASLAANPANLRIDVPKVSPAIVLERRDVVPVVFETAGDLAFGGFTTVATTLGNVNASELQRTLRAEDFVQELDKARDQVRQEFDLDRSVSVSAAGVSLGLSVAYVLWLVRGGVLMGSYLSAMPAWKMLDPLPVLSHVDGGIPDDDDALDAEADKPVDPLRGMG
jgi:hypothetical protein